MGSDRANKQTVFKQGPDHEHTRKSTKRKLLYTARTHTTGGREHGASRSSDGHLTSGFSTPGTAGIGTNPEQLFAAGWSACFEGAMGIAARKMRVAIPADMAIDPKST